MRPFAAVLLLCSCAACGVIPTISFEGPGNYVGWAHVDLLVPACPPLTGEWRKVTFKVGPDGHGCTSSDYPDGWQFTEYRDAGSHAVLPDRDPKAGRAAWALSVGVQVSSESAQQKHYVSFFVGSKAQLQSSPRPFF
jgi:hypothetical protein